MTLRGVVSRVTEVGLAKCVLVELEVLVKSGKGRGKDQETFIIHCPPTSTANLRANPIRVLDEVLIYGEMVTTASRRWVLSADGIRVLNDTSTTRGLTGCVTPSEEVRQITTVRGSL